MEFPGIVAGSVSDSDSVLDSSSLRSVESRNISINTAPGHCWFVGRLSGSVSTLPPLGKLVSNWDWDWNWNWNCQRRRQVKKCPPRKRVRRHIGQHFLSSHQSTSSSSSASWVSRFPHIAQCQGLHKRRAELTLPTAQQPPKGSLAKKPKGFGALRNTGIVKNG